MQRLRNSGASIFARLVAVPNLRRKALNSWSAVQDTYFSTKDIFERHRVVFTVSTSIASVATAWIGYSLRYVHQSKVEERLESIEKAQMKNDRHLEYDEIKKIVSLSTVSIPACIATAGTSLIIGYAFGWRGGKWYANRNFKKEQMKLLGQIKPGRWEFKFLKRPLVRSKVPDSVRKSSESLQNTTPSVPSKPTGHRSC